ncbi:uridine kinase, partial [Klebsiella pneumoniae]|uniref:uridine kinase n=1 Tax=Klebsiella pneumoniae TaxID=573 RepID=UPI001F51C4C1
VTVEPKKVIILEGILLLTDARLRDELNFSIFVDTPLDICLMRRIKRDVNERGRSMDSVMAQYQKTVRPMFLQFIEPSKQYADIIVPRGGKNRIAIDILKAKILSLLSKGRKAQEEIQKLNGKKLNEKVIHFTNIGQALIKAKQEKLDVFEVLESVIE